MKTLGERIKYLRGQDSQEVFAAKLGVSKGALGGYERDENSPSAEVVLKICSAANISAEWLVFGPVRDGSTLYDGSALHDGSVTYGSGATRGRGEQSVERGRSGASAEKEALKDMIIEQAQKLTASQEREIEMLKAQVQDLKAEITELKSRLSLSALAADERAQANTA